jgi:hypothetical protein
MSGKRKVWFSQTERQALQIAIGFITSGEWDETLSQRQYDALQTSHTKLEMDAQDAALMSKASWDEEFNCSECGTVIGDNVSGLCLVCSDTKDANTAREER